MEKRHFFAAFLVCALLLAGGLDLTAQSIQELRGEKVVLEVTLRQVRGLITRTGEVVRGYTRHLLASFLRWRIVLWCRDGLAGIKSIQMRLRRVIERILAPVGLFLQHLRKSDRQVPPTKPRLRKSACLPCYRSYWTGDELFMPLLR